MISHMAEQSHANNIPRDSHFEFLQSQKPWSLSFLTFISESVTEYRIYQEHLLGYDLGAVVASQSDHHCRNVVDPGIAYSHITRPPLRMQPSTP